jgi:hypothetical protein
MILCACQNSIGALPSFSGAILVSSWVALDIQSIEFNKQPG